jgi:hypothetical protein
MVQKYLTTNWLSLVSLMLHSRHHPILQAGLPGNFWLTVWLLCILLGGTSAFRADTTVEWKGGEGDWAEAAQWGGTLPWRTAEARINGTRAQPSGVTVARSDVLVNHLSVGDGGNSQASLVLDGRSMAVTAGIDVGKYDGSEGKLTVNGNVMDGMSDVSGENWKGVKGDRALQAPSSFPAPPVRTQSAQDAFEQVLQNAGASLPKRDAVDARAVSDARNGTGKIINNENEVGGWPDYKSGNPAVSSANDGIPDEWKKAHGLSITDPNAANAVNAEGYTVLEMYLNSLAEH